MFTPRLAKVLSGAERLAAWRDANDISHCISSSETKRAKPSDRRSVPQTHEKKKPDGHKS